MPLSEAHIQRAAQRLLDARTNRIRLDDWPEELRPQSTQDAEAICEVMAQGLERPIAGWKVGCSDPASPTKLGLERPFCGQIPARLIYSSGALIPWGELLRPVVEAEIVFRLGQDLPPRSAPYTLRQVADAIDNTLPGIEIPESRLSDRHTLGALGMVADQGYAGRLVLGEGITGWRTLDLAHQAVRLYINGEEIARGSSAKAMGNPLQALLWLANYRRERGDGLKAGQFISTGSLTGIQWTKTGDLVLAAFGSLGQAELRMV